MTNLVIRKKSGNPQFSFNFVKLVGRSTFWTKNIIKILKSAHIDSQFIYLWSMRCVNYSVGIRWFDNQFVERPRSPPAGVIIGFAVSQCRRTHGPRVASVSFGLLL